MGRYVPFVILLTTLIHFDSDRATADRGGAHRTVVRSTRSTAARARDSRSQLPRVPRVQRVMPGFFPSPFSFRYPVQTLFPSSQTRVARTPSLGDVTLELPKLSELPALPSFTLPALPRTTPLTSSFDPGLFKGLFGGSSSSPPIGNGGPSFAGPGRSPASKGGSSGGGGSGGGSAGGSGGGGSAAGSGGGGPGGGSDGSPFDPTASLDPALSPDNAPEDSAGGTGTGDTGGQVPSHSPDGFLPQPEISPPGSSLDSGASSLPQPDLESPVAGFNPQPSFPTRERDDDSDDEIVGDIDPRTVSGVRDGQRIIPRATRDPKLIKRKPGEQTPYNVPDDVKYQFPSNVSNTPEFQAAIGKCLKCHTNQDIARALKTPQGLSYHLATMNNGLLSDMIGRAGLTHDEEKAIRDYVTSSRDEAGAYAAHSQGGNAPACYMTETEQAVKTHEMPDVDGDSSFLASAIAGGKGGRTMMFYDRSAVPRMWLNTGSDGATAKFSTARNATNPDMMQKMHYNSDGAREFPWLHSAGMDSSPNGTSEKFVIRSSTGRLGRIVERTRQTHPHYFGTSTNVNGPNIGIEYDPGTTFGEVLKVQDPQTGESIPFEVRVRHKMPSGEWKMDVLRPFESPADLAQGIRRVCTGSAPPDGCEMMGALVAELESPKTRVARRTEFIYAEAFGTIRDPLTLSSTADEATMKTSTLHELPDMPPALVRALLKSTPFKSVMNKPWIPASGDRPAGWAPVAKSGFNIVPRNYFASFIPMTQNGCMNCHDAAGRHVDNFDPSRDQMFAPAPNDAPRPRTWYNMIPGDDHILSFHPFDKAMVERGSLATRNALNKCLVEKGLVR